MRREPRRETGTHVEIFPWTLPPQELLVSRLLVSVRCCREHGCQSHGRYTNHTSFQCGSLALPPSQFPASNLPSGWAPAFTGVKLKVFSACGGCLCPSVQWPGPTIRPETEHFPLCSSDIQISNSIFRFPLLRFRSLLNSVLPFTSPKRCVLSPLSTHPFTTTTYHPPPSSSYLSPNLHLNLPSPHPTNFPLLLIHSSLFPICNSRQFISAQSASPLPESTTLIYLFTLRPAICHHRPRPRIAHGIDHHHHVSQRHHSLRDRVQPRHPRARPCLRVRAVRYLAKANHYNGTAMTRLPPSSTVPVLDPPSPSLSRTPVHLLHLSRPPSSRTPPPNPLRLRIRPSCDSLLSPVRLSRRLFAMSTALHDPLEVTSLSFRRPRPRIIHSLLSPSGRRLHVPSPPRRASRPSTTWAEHLELDHAPLRNGIHHLYETKHFYVSPEY